MAAGLFSLTTLQNLLTSGFGLYNALQPGAHIDFTVTEDQTNGTVIQFAGFDIPTTLTDVGGEQKIAIHDFPGGVRAIQTLGAFPHALKWNGTLVGDLNGQSPSQRSVLMDLVRRHGNEVTLKYGDFEWKGVVTRYHANFEHQNLIRYTMEFTPVEANDAVVQETPVTTPQGLFKTILNKLKNLVSSALGLTPTQLNALTGLFQTIDSALLPVEGVLSAILPADLAAIQAAIFGATGLLSFAGTTPNLSTSSEVQSILTLLGGLGGVLKSLPGAPTVINTVNPILPHISSAYLKNSTRWPEIAALNNTLDDRIVGPVALKIPST